MEWSRRADKPNTEHHKSPWGSGRWEEPRGSQEQEESDEDPGHSHDGGPWRSRRSEEPWWRSDRRLHRTDQRQWSRWWWSPRRTDGLWWRRGSWKPWWSRWVAGLRRSLGLGGWRWSRGILQTQRQRSWGSADQRRAHTTNDELRVSRVADDEIQRRWCRNKK